MMKMMQQQQQQQQEQLEATDQQQLGGGGSEEPPQAGQESIRAKRILETIQDEEEAEARVLQVIPQKRPSFVDRQAIVVLLKYFRTHPYGIFQSFFLQHVLIFRNPEYNKTHP